MSDVILIHPPTILDPSLFKRKFLSAPLVHYGYGMLYLGSFLVKNGYKVKFINVPELYQWWGYGKEVISRFTFSGSHGRTPILFGIELNWMHQSLGAIELAKRLKEIFPEVFIVFGGVHASLFAKEILSEYSDCVDGVIRGEAELPILDLLKKLESSKSSLEDVSGLVWTKNGKIIENPITKIPENIDEIPPYSTKELGLNKLFVIPAVNIARGPCSMRCIYCIGPLIPRIFGRQKMVCHSVDWIIEQISILIEEGYRRLFFQDYFWSSGKRNLMEIAKGLQKERINEKLDYFNMTSAPGFLDEELLENFSRAGVDNIDWGVESGSQRVLDIVKRDVTISQIKDSIKTSVRKGIIPNTFWMVGLPGETLEDVRKTFYLLKETIELGGVPRWVTPLIVVPKTRLYEEPERYGIRLLFKSFRDYMAFSNTEHNPNAWYPNLITHETKNFGVYDILKIAFMLRMLIKRSSNLILEKAKENSKIYAEYHPHLSLSEVETRVKSSISVIQGSFW
ncbi:MAG: radical SAM protein [Ignisphaera sp.]